MPPCPDGSQDEASSLRGAPGEGEGDELAKAFDYLEMVIGDWDASGWIGQ